MSNLRFILRQLEPFLIRTAHVSAGWACPDRVELLCDQQELTADYLYLGDVSSAALVSRAKIAPGTTILLAGICEGTLPALQPKDYALVYLFCPLATLHNTVAHALACTADWQQAYMDLTDQGGGLHAIVALTQQLAQSAVLLLDQTGRVVAGSGLDESAYLAAQVSSTGALPQRTAELIFPQGSEEGPGFYLVPNTDLTLYGYSMAHQGTPIGTLLLEGRQTRGDLDFQSLCICCADCLFRRLLSPDPDRLGSSTKVFQQCWDDIAERRLTGAAEIHEALSRMPHTVEQFARVAVITFAADGAGVPYNYLIARLRELFPNTNMAVYRKDVVMLLTYPERTFRRALGSDTQLFALLARYDGFAAISNGTRNFDALGSIFQLAKRTSTLAQFLRQRSDERIFFHEDYSMYCVIDLCAQRYLEIDGNDDVLYLIHPAVIHLTRYDRQHNSNLRDVLYFYLLNDRNLVKTSAATYMHRNTVINKVNKILELVDLDMEDGNLRQRLMFSCQVIRYYEKFMKREINLG